MKQIKTIYSVVCASLISLGIQAQLDSIKINSNLFNNDLIESQENIQLQGNYREYSFEPLKRVEQTQNFLIKGKNEAQDAYLILRKKANQISGFMIDYALNLAYEFSADQGNYFLIETPMETILPNDSALVHPHEEGYHYEPDALLPIGNNLTANAFFLQSRPGASTTILLDFDGEDISDWGYRFPTVYPSNYTEDQVRKIWETIAADLLMFDVNVTTDTNVYNQYVLEERMKCVFGEATGLNQVGGLSLVDIFGTGSGCLVNSRNGDRGVETAHIGSHEIGHALGLFHDGTMWPGPSIPYYEGHADWAPIMGLVYGKKYVTWNPGNYEFASQPQDDIAIIAGHCGYAEDDQNGIHQLIVGRGDSINTLENNGIIDSPADIDTFEFVLADTGRVRLAAGTAVLHTDLDIEMRLLSQNFTQLVFRNPILDRSAAMDTVLTPGTYYVLIAAGGENTADDGFTNYSSFGYYEFHGEIEGLQKPAYDIAINGYEGFDEYCGATTEGSVWIKNNGDSIIESVQVNIYLDGALHSTNQYNVQLNSDALIALGPFSFNDFGQHTVQFEVVLEGSQVEAITQNNQIVIEYELTSGEMMFFRTNHPRYNTQSPYYWNVLSDNSTVIDGRNVPSSEDESYTEQRFCLETDCYEFELTGDYNLCSSYPAYQNGATYVANDIVAYQGKVYQAKWWNTNLPTTSAWEEIGVCNEGQYFIEIYQSQIDSVLLYFENNDIASNSTNEGFCMPSIITSVSEQLQERKYQVFPNPAVHLIELHSNQNLGPVEITNISGKVVHSAYYNQPSTTLSVAHLTDGIYFVRFFEGNVVFKLVKVK